MDEASVVPAVTDKQALDPAPRAAQGRYAQKSDESDRKRRQTLGQFLTPPPVADLMAGFFHGPWRRVNLLDPGAGEGSLTCAFVRRMCQTQKKPQAISVTAYELDTLMLGPLERALSGCKKDCERVGIKFRYKIHHSNFISTVAPSIKPDLFTTEPERFNFAIVNPPYRKIRSDSLERIHLRLAGVETTNLYAGFLSIITRLLTKGGQLVAITPRSFCNGPYFKPFRVAFLDQMAIRRLHVFESRVAAFRTQNVLQENVIIHAVKGNQKPHSVVVSQSSGEPGDKGNGRRVELDDVILPDDRDKFIHFPVGRTQKHAKAAVQRLSATLANLGIQVSTGRVVDFRAARFLRQDPTEDTVPLIYPNHFCRFTVEWPKAKSRKPNATRCPTLSFMIQNATG
ncbi:MAG TPA: Eco57I restriction-modification methylase domain-containing protein [Nitrospira sp.]|nr:Eco57I restriction-modification methylase domain-containing protein [Nitrospira sp.]